MKHFYQNILDLLENYIFNTFYFNMYEIFFQNIVDLYQESVLDRYYLYSIQYMPIICIL